jgi:hypothetical protein
MFPEQGGIGGRISVNKSNNHHPVNKLPVYRFIFIKVQRAYNGI